jgi:hypothetical protein
VRVATSLASGKDDEEQEGTTVEQLSSHLTDAQDAIEPQLERRNGWERSP